MDQTIKSKFQALVQKQINNLHITKPRSYKSTTPNGVVVDRIGLTVYLENDNQVDGLSKILKVLSEEGNAGNPDPIVVDVFGTNFIVAGAQRSDYVADIEQKDGSIKHVENYSKRPKAILADQVIGSNAEVTSSEEVTKNIRMLQEMRESNKSLRSQFSGLRKQVAEVSADEFDKYLN